MFNMEFWQSFLSNALATLIGVIIGIPVALWIYRVQQNISNLAESRKLDTEAGARKRKILELLYNELSLNKNVLETIQQYYKPMENWKDAGIVERFEFYRKKSDEGFNSKYVYLLRTELWNAFSDGGELQWIQDLNLLHELANAYEVIRMVKYVGEAYSSLESNLEVRFGARGSRPDSLIRESDELYEDFLAHLRIANESIENTLAVVSSGGQVANIN